MTGPKPTLTMDDISPEARRAAADAAEAAGMPLEIWLGQLIKYVSVMEQKDRETVAPAIDPATEILSNPIPEAAPGPAPAPTNPAPSVAEPAAKNNDLDTADVAAQEPPDRDSDTAESPAGNAPRPAAPPPQPPHPAMASGAGDQWSVGMAATDSMDPSHFAAEYEPAETDIDAAIDAWRRDGGFEPLVVRHDPHMAGGFEIIAGTDRWLAARRVEVRELPIIIKELSDGEALKAVLVQQLRRKSTSPADEASIYRRLLDDAELSVAELAKTVGRAPAHVSNTLRLLELPEAVQAMVRNGELTVLHARALLSAEDPLSAAREVVARRLDIYQTEQLVRSTGGGGARAQGGNANDNMATTQVIERQLSALLGLKISINEHDKIGVLSIHYTNRDQLSDLVARLNTSGG